MGGALGGALGDSWQNAQAEPCRQREGCAEVHAVPAGDDVARGVRPRERATTFGRG